MAFTEKIKDMHPRSAPCVVTLKSDSLGATTSWVAVDRADVGLDLRVVSGNAYVEATACAPDNMANSVATMWDKGVVAGPGSSSSILAGASHVRLVATGEAELSVRT